MKKLLFAATMAVAFLRVSPAAQAQTTTAPSASTSEAAASDGWDWPAPATTATAPAQAPAPSPATSLAPISPPTAPSLTRAAPSARPPGDPVSLSYVVEQRCFTMVDVTHDRDDWRTRLELLGKIGDDRLLEARRVFLFLDRLKTEFTGDELDLIEVEPLVDRDH